MAVYGVTVKKLYDKLVKRKQKAWGRVDELQGRRMSLSIWRCQGVNGGGVVQTLPLKPRFYKTGPAYSSD